MANWFKNKSKFGGIGGRQSAASKGSILGFEGDLLKWRKQFVTGLYASTDFVDRQTALLLDMTKDRHLITDAEYTVVVLTEGSVDLEPAFMKLSEFDNEHALAAAGTQHRSALGRLNFTALKKLRTGTHLIDDSKSSICLREAKSVTEIAEGKQGESLIDFVSRSSLRLLDILRDRVTNTLWQELDKQLTECGEAGASGYVAMHLLKGIKKKNRSEHEREWFGKRQERINSAKTLQAARFIMEEYREQRVEAMTSLGIQLEHATKLVDRDTLFEALALVEKSFPEEHEMFLNRYTGDPDIGGKVDANVFWNFFQTKGILRKKIKTPKPPHNNKRKLGQPDPTAGSFNTSTTSYKKRKKCAHCGSDRHFSDKCFRKYPHLIVPYFKERNMPVPQALKKYIPEQQANSASVEGGGASKDC